ncbi:MAG TPA: hypothetical protein VIO58_12020 [Candidatus Methanoperedens sp.]
MKKNVSIIIIYLILSGFIGLASASSVDISQLQWREDGMSGKLIRGQEISYMGYSAKVTTFPQGVESGKYDDIPSEPVLPFVGLNISKNGSLINTTILQQGESFITSDQEMRIAAEDLPPSNSTAWLFQSYKPWAVIKFYPRGTPDIDVSVETDYDEYVSLPATEIAATVTLKNIGSADMVDVDLDIDTELQVKNGNLKYHYDRIKKGETIENTITFTSPILTEKKSYEILANVSGYDVKGIPYNTKSLKTILITTEPQQIPNMRKITNPRIYLKDTAMVSISIKNNANYDLKNVSIKDSLPKGFRLLGNKSLHWVVDIPANGEWNTRYLIKPQESKKDGIDLPAAIAEFQMKKEYYIIRSNRPEITVHGPRIVLYKKTDVSEVRPGGVLTVTVSAMNDGSTPTKVTINDVLPESATLVSGSTSYEEYLEADRSVSFSYTISINSEQPVELPQATAEYFELGTEGGKISTVSPEVKIMIKSPDEIPALPPEDMQPASSPDIPDSTPVNVLEEPVHGQPLRNESVNESPKERPQSAQQPTGASILLNLILGCDNIGNNKGSDAVYKICNYFGQGQPSVIISPVPAKRT